MVIDKLKKCTKCKKEKKLVKFSKDKKQTDNLRIWCKLCCKKYYEKYPWKRIFYYINTRCQNPNSKDYKNYGGRGIEANLSISDIRFLYVRDKAQLMKKPNIDREDNDGNYELSNCRFIEKSENIAKRNKESWSKSVLQYSLNGEFIKKFNSIKKAGQTLNIDRGDISRCANGKANIAGKYLWKF